MGVIVIDNVSTEENKHSREQPMNRMEACGVTVIIETYGEGGRPRVKDEGQCRVRL
jgi:hypothetical protein